MAFRLPPLREIPSVWAALRWLLGHCVGTPHGNLLIKARLRGLLMADGSNNWKADGPLATRLTREALKRLPRDPAELGRILHGLGEINARTNADLITPVIRHLRKQRPRIPFLKVFDAAAACEAKASGPPQLNAIDLAQWVSGSLLTWATFDRAVYRIGHLDIINPGRFGLGFAAKVITALDVGAIDTWIRHHPNRLRVATIAGAMLPSVSDADIMERATRLLRSRVPALKCLGAAFYVCPIFPRSPLDDFHESRRGLVANGVDPGDATWMMAYRIKNAVHSRYWTQHQLEQARARLRYLESKPEAAIGGRHNFEAEVRSLHTQIDRSSDRLTELGAALESMLEDLAAGWPADGLTEDQMHALENNFVQTPEIRVRVAGKLPQGANRTSLLKRDIDQLRNFIGLSKNPAEVLDTDFNPNDNRFEVILPWAAQSLILLYDDERRGVGKRTSDLVADLSKAFEALAAEPFAAQRKSGRWHSAYGRTASAYIFALLVVASMPEARRSEVATLNGLALDHVFQLLCIPYPDGRTSQLIFKLTARAVHQMDYSADGEKRRRQWAHSEHLPGFARALALWSSPALVLKDKALAFQLFRRMAELPLSRGARDVQISRMLTLLDLAIASCAKDRQPGLVRDLIALWAELYQNWVPITDRFLNAAEMMVAAIDRDGPERVALFAEPAFAQTHCRLLIDRQRAEAGQSENAE